jgi:hypothetical protein
MAVVDISILQVKYGVRYQKISLGSMSRDVHSCTHWLIPHNL